MTTCKTKRRSAAVRPDVCRRIAEAAGGIRYAGVDIAVRDVCRHRARPGLRVRPHRHTYYEALLIVAGEAAEQSDFRQRLAPGVIQLHAPGHRHAWEGGNMELERFGFYFSLPTPLALRPLKQWPVIPAALDELNALVAETQSTGPGRAARIRARFVLLGAHFFELLDWSLTETVELPWNESSLAEVVDRHLSDNLDLPIGLPEIALFAGVSVPTLTRRYKAETGATVIDRLNGLRLERAARLLAETDQPIATIATRTGFTEASYFCNRFRKRYHCTPSEYRGRLQQDVSR